MMSREAPFLSLDKVPSLHFLSLKTLNCTFSDKICSAWRLLRQWIMSAFLFPSLAMLVENWFDFSLHLGCWNSHLTFQQQSVSSCLLWSGCKYCLRFPSPRYYLCSLLQEKLSGLSSWANIPPETRSDSSHMPWGSIWRFWVFCCCCCLYSIKFAFAFFHLFFFLMDLVSASRDRIFLMLQEIDLSWPEYWGFSFPSWFAINHKMDQIMVLGISRVSGTSSFLAG